MSLGTEHTNPVAEVVGVSIGPLCQYYPSQEAILVDLIGAMRRQILDDMTTAAVEARGRSL